MWVDDGGAVLNCASYSFRSDALPWATSRTQHTAHHLTMEKKFRKTMTSLDDVFDFLSQSMDACNVDAPAAFAVNLAVEEFFTNMVKYGSGQHNDILVSLTREARCLTVSLVDSDVDPFDVTKAGDIDPARPLHERKIGGLGIHLAKHMVDSISYEYVNRHSKITFTKNLEK